MMGLGIEPLCEFPRRFGVAEAGANGDKQRAERESSRSPVDGSGKVFEGHVAGAIATGDGFDQ